MRCRADIVSRQHKYIFHFSFPFHLIARESCVRTVVKVWFHPNLNCFFHLLSPLANFWENNKVLCKTTWNGKLDVTGWNKKNAYQHKQNIFIFPFTKLPFYCNCFYIGCRVYFYFVYKLTLNKYTK